MLRFCLGSTKRSGMRHELDICGTPKEVVVSNVATCVGKGPLQNPLSFLAINGSCVASQSHGCQATQLAYQRLGC